MTTEELTAIIKNNATSIHFVLTFTHGVGIQLMSGKRKIAPILLPTDEQNVGDILVMLGQLRSS